MSNPVESNVLALVEQLKSFTAGIRTDLRATVQQVADIYEGDRRRNALVASATTIAEVAEAGLDQMDAALAVVLEAALTQRRGTLRGESREEFERDRFGETGDNYRERRGTPEEKQEEG